PDLVVGGNGAPLALTLATRMCTIETVTALKQVLGRHPGPSDVHLRLVNGDSSTVLRLDDHLRVEPSSSLMGDLKALLGPGCLAAGASAAPAAPRASSGRREAWQMSPPGAGGTLEPVTATDSAPAPAGTTDDIDTAARRIGDTIRCTELQVSDRLSERS